MKINKKNKRNTDREKTAKLWKSLLKLLVR